MAYNSSNGQNGYYDPRSGNAYPNGSQYNDNPRQIVQVQVPRLPFPGNLIQNNHLPYQSNQAVSYPSPQSSSPQPQYAQYQVQAQHHDRPANVANGYQSQRHIERPQVPPPAVEKEPPPIDYSLLLIDLAEEYFDAAYGNEAKGGTIRREADHEIFCKRVATGLGCLEIVLREWRLDSHVEACARLRYASVLFQDTENFTEVEEMLSKGISLCERYRLIDLKYNMQHLLARVTFASNQRAGLRFLDGIIKDADAEQHVSWIYALRFLRVSLAMPMSNTQESLIAINQLKVIATLANNRGDSAVTATASAIEALIHINRSNTSEAIEQAQRALAAARSSQLSPIAQRLPQITMMTHFVDLCCSVFPDDPDQAGNKMRVLHSTLDSLSEDDNWSDNGTFLVPLSPTTARSIPGRCLDGGILRPDSTGNVAMQISWLPKDEVYTLGYILSAIVTVYKNASDGQRAENFLREAIAQLDLNKRSRLEPDDPWRQILRCQIQAQLVFALCGRSAWGAAKKELSVLKLLESSLPPDSIPSMPLIVQYLEGSICQGTGDLSTALSIFSGPLLKLDPQQNTPESPIHRSLSILAALNTLMIIHLPSHPNHHQLPSILESLKPLVLTHKSRNIHSAFNLIRAVSIHKESGNFLETKTYLQPALQEAKSTANSQLMCITLNFMCFKFFRGMVGEQPQKSARSALGMAKKGQNELWTSVAEGMLAETLETQGMSVEAEQARREASQIAGRLPAVMQREINR